ncbi:MAG: hypothetical protein IJD41_01505 [Alphaproteobacteria bacterium]|nr:hypothetical protein [Alphaproteobacteria bacterium]MBQ7127575.1 hypothetical protein [Alphaproteobacteria bacterium]
MNDDYELRAILHELEQFFRLHPHYEIDGLTLLTLQNIIHKQVALYLLRAKRYIVEIQEADSDISIREIIHRKKYRL